MTGDLSGRLEVTGTGDEFDRLADSLNAMLDRIEHLLYGVKDVSDNIAHDLKTPLTRLRNRVEAALAGPTDAASYRATLEATIEESDQLIKTFNALLMIARIEAGSPEGAMAEVDASAIVRDVAELYEPVADETGIELAVETPEPVTIKASRELLGQALANLIDNAIKYGTAAERQDSDRDKDRPRRRLARAPRRRQRSGHSAGRPRPGAAAIRPAGEKPDAAGKRPRIEPCGGGRPPAPWLDRARRRQPGPRRHDPLAAEMTGWPLRPGRNERRPKTLGAADAAAAAADAARHEGANRGTRGGGQRRQGAGDALAGQARGR